MSDEKTSYGGGPMTGVGKSYWDRLAPPGGPTFNLFNPNPVAAPTEEKRKTFISIDLETTGLEFDKHGIIQIGAWATGETEDHFKGYFVMDVNPHIPRAGEERKVQISPQALEVNGFTPARINDGVPLFLAMREFAKWLSKWTTDSDVICVGQNVAFDLAWLKRDFYRQGLDTGYFRRNIDCYTLSFLAFGRPLSLGSVAKKLGVRYPAHDALSDAYAASVVAHRLTKFLAKEYPSETEATKLPNFFQSVFTGGTESTCVR